jgi:hypothetical protein
MLENIKLLQLIQEEKRQVNAVFLLNVSKNVGKKGICTYGNVRC